MKVINYDASRVSSLFPLEEVLPLSGINDREIIEAVTQRYKFLKSPDLAKDDIAKDGYRFSSGQIPFDSSVFRINDFSIFRDGLVINAATTDGSEFFLNDVITFMQDEFSFRTFNTPPYLYFQSQLVVEFERSPERLLKSLDKIMDIVSVPVSKIYETKMLLKFARLDFEYDKTSKIDRSPAPAIAPKFIIERRQGISFDKERYFSGAPMRTGDHERVLTEIEELFD
jgi:hypothetical protein